MCQACPSTANKTHAGQQETSQGMQSKILLRQATKYEKDNNLTTSVAVKLDQVTPIDHLPNNQDVSHVYNIFLSKQRIMAHHAYVISVIQNEDVSYFLCVLFLREISVIH